VLVERLVLVDAVPDAEADRDVAPSSEEKRFRYSSAQGCQMKSARCS
jgi:hypothetical protein